jgi:two-component system cell cycle response regulator
MASLGETDHTAGLRVLVADDDVAMRRLLSLWLTQAGYDVHTAEDGRQAIEMMEADCPDMLVTDWEMPRVDGPDLCRHVRQMQTPNYVYVLFLTVRSARDEVVRGLDIGADDFLTKPIERVELLARMRSGRRIIQLERRLQHMASTDLLTGLLTRRSFFALLEREWQRCLRTGRPLSSVMLDIDFFKRINDQYGHPAGDVVLRTVARLLRETSRQTDLICRFGGEEFCVLLPETADPDAQAWAERFRAQLATLAIPIGDPRLKVTCSYGTAQRRDDTQSYEQLLDRADQALLCAKQWGRDRVVGYESLGENAALQVRDRDLHDRLFHGCTAGQVMTPIIACLRQDEPIGLAADFFLRTRITSAPVVDSHGDLVGMLSEKDILVTLASKDCWTRPIREVMKPNVICYDENTPVRTIFEFLCRVSIRRVAITEGKRPTGTISRGTLLRWVNNLMAVAAGADASEGRHSPEARALAARTRLVGTADAVREQTRRLADRLHRDCEDPVATVVGGVSSIQDLLDDLMAHARSPSSDDDASTEGALMFGSYPD